MKFNLLRWLLAYLVVMVGCSNKGGIPAIQPIVSRVALESFSSCPELKKYIADTAVLQMRSQIEAYKSGGIGVAGGVRQAGPPVPGAAGAADAAAQPAPSSYTQTNVQVPGVDEADFVKNDGTRIFVLAGDKLYLNESWPPAGLKTVGKIALEGWPREMFLDSNHLVVFSSFYMPYPLADRALRSMAPIMCVRSMDCGYFHSNSVKVTVLNVTDLANPKVEQEYYLPGSYTSARRIGSSVRLVLNDGFRWPPEMKWWPDYDPGLYADKDRLARAQDVLMAQNEEIIRAQPLEAWLPLSSHKLPDGTLENLPYSCSDFSRTNAPTRLGIVTVATLNLEGPTANQITQTSIIAEPGQIYASAHSLYVATGHWWWWLEPGQHDFTYLHKFDITQPDRAIYVASGGVDGEILNQFSMDEDSSGFFRVATNTSIRVADPQFPWGRLQTTNRVSVLSESGGQLRVIGESEELAPGERITSARFVGNKAFVVTVRQVDPLFTLDLSDPTHPKRVGELKVPGFSTYIHPLSDKYILTIGQYLPENGDWRARAIKLSIFDLADFANPREKFTQLVGTSYGWSEAAYEHRALNYFAEKKLLAIPFSDRNPACAGWCGFVSDLRVFTVDPETGIVPKGALNMSDVYRAFNNDRWQYYWAPSVRRSVMADNFAYAISDAGIRVADVDTLGSPIKTAVFDAPSN